MRKIIPSGVTQDRMSEPEQVEDVHVRRSLPCRRWQSPSKMRRESTQGIGAACVESQCLKRIRKTFLWKDSQVSYRKIARWGVRAPVA